MNLAVDAREERGIQQAGWEDLDDRPSVDGPTDSADWGGAGLLDRSKRSNPQPEMNQGDEWVGDPLLGLGGGPDRELFGFTGRADAPPSDPTVADAHGFGQHDPSSDPESREARGAGTQPLDRRVQLSASCGRGSFGANCHGRA
jgi:hypothetical protein